LFSAPRSLGLSACEQMGRFCPVRWSSPRRRSGLSLRRVSRTERRRPDFDLNPPGPLPPSSPLFQIGACSPLLFDVSLGCFALHDVFVLSHPHILWGFLKSHRLPMTGFRAFLPPLWRQQAPEQRQPPKNPPTQPNQPPSSRVEPFHIEPFSARYVVSFCVEHSRLHRVSASVAARSFCRRGSVL